MLKKLTVLAMTVGAVAAFALPASASAAWKHHSTSIATDQTVGFTGNARFQGGLGGIECQITSQTKFLAGQTTGTAETFVAHPTSDTANCRGLGGLAFCQIHNLTPQQAANWTIHTATATTVSVTTTTIHSQATGAFCPVTTISLTAGTATLTPEKKNAEGKFVANPDTVETATISGSLQADLTTSGGSVDTETVTISGDLLVESPNANTYSI
jgi:hypothetical protein